MQTLERLSEAQPKVYIHCHKGCILKAQEHRSLEYCEWQRVAPGRQSSPDTWTGTRYSLNESLFLYSVIF